ACMFFFSSRRRHTNSYGDWSSDVCSSDLARAATRRGAAAPAAPTSARPVAGRASAPLRRLPALGMPEPSSARFGAGLVKRLVRRLTAWEVEPVVEQVNQLQRAAVEAAELSTAEDDHS